MQHPVVVEQRGSFLLVRRADEFAVVERRAGHLYAMHEGVRDAYPDTPAGVAAAVGAAGWHDEAAARQTLQDLVRRGEQLAQTLR